nr:MAG TPA: hypothetical protein [Caudoviricetes sp.]
MPPIFFTSDTRYFSIILSNIFFLFSSFLKTTTI